MELKHLRVRVRRVRNEKLVRVTFMSLASYATGDLILGDAGECAAYALGPV